MSRFAITQAIIFTLDPNNRVIPDGTLLIENGRILAVGERCAITLPEGTPVINAEGKALLPGLIDSHSHSSLMRGMTENLQLMDWLPLYQLEHRALTEEDAWHSARLCYLEALKNGTTCVMDMYRYMDRCADAAVELGIRANLAPYVADAPGKDFFSTPDENEHLARGHHLRANGRIRVWMGLEHLFYCTERAFKNAIRCAQEYGLGIHTHASEQKEEEAAVLKHFGRRSIGQLDHYGILGENTLLAHCVWLNSEEIKRLSDTGTKVAHCPVSNAKLASGVAPVAEMQAQGLTLGLGTDGNICNNSLDLFEEMKFGSLIQKATHLDPTALPATQMLRMATIEGAKALGLDTEIGSLELGKRADLILVDVKRPNLTPVTLDEQGGNLLWNLVFAARGSDVTDVWVDGERLIESGQVLSVDETKLIKEAQQCAESLSRRCQALADQVVPVN